MKGCMLLASVFILLSSKGILLSYSQNARALLLYYNVNVGLFFTLNIVYKKAGLGKNLQGGKLFRAFERTKGKCSVTVFYYCFAVEPRGPN